MMKVTVEANTISYITVINVLFKACEKAQDFTASELMGADVTEGRRLHNIGSEVRGHRNIRIEGRRLHRIGIEAHRLHSI